MTHASVFEKNMQAMKAHRKELAEEIQAIKDIPAFSMATATSGEPEIRCHFSDGAGRPYYPTASPRLWSQDLIDRLELKNPRMLVFLGMGLGYHLEHVARAPHPLNQIILIVEPFPQIFKFALKTCDLTPFIASPNVFFWIGSDIGALGGFLGNLFANTGRLQFAHAIDYVLLEPANAFSADFFDQVPRAIAQAIGHQFNRYFSDPYDAWMGISCTVRNIDRVSRMRPIDAAYGRFRGRPGVLVASGPSLERSLDALKAVQGQVVMAACPSALPLLLRHGIHPHIWVNIERTEAMVTLFDELAIRPPHVFVAPPLVDPRCFEVNGGHNAYILGESLLSRWLAVEGTPVYLGQSAAHAAFQILSRLGCDPVYLVGQDLAYSDAASHADGVWNESRRMMMGLKDTRQKIFSVEGNSGSPVELNLFWFTFFKTFMEEIFPLHKGSIVNVIPGDHGVKLAGLRRIDPDALPADIQGEAFHALATLTEALSPRPEKDAESIRSLIAARAGDAAHAIGRFQRDATAFAMRCKAIPFTGPFALKNWPEAKPLYHAFLTACDTHTNRFQNDPAHRPDREVYWNVFRPLVQGLLLQAQMDFFRSASDLSGDFSEITRKAELLYHMWKDEAFWAGEAKGLMEGMGKELARS